MLLHSLQALHRIHNTFPQRSIRQAQHVLRPRIIKPVRALLRVITGLQGVPRRQLLLQLRKRVRDDLRDFFVAEVPAHNEEAFTSGLGLLGREHVGQGEVAHVDEEVVHRRRAGGFGGAGHEIAGALVGSVEG